ncbi:MAG: cysteine desulfurase [Planctomycetes bacterium]|nr:cysteine desulfurase [Planctomycetota bacterium]
MDVRSVRPEFPILAREIHPGIPLVYLDSAATALKPTCVIEAVAEHYRWHTANVHRGVHRLAEEATEAYEWARERVARFIGSPSAREVIFTHGTTEGINLVAWSWAGQHVGRGDEIVVSEMEHHANLIPWQQVAAETGAVLRFIPLTDDGQLDLAALDALLSRRTKLVAVAAVSNVLGTVNPVQTIAAMAHAVGARVLFDAAQSVPHLPTDVTGWDCDFLAFSGHKMCGPDGVGVLYAKGDLLDSMPPFLTGGNMVRRVRPTAAEWNEPPWKFEAGTPPIASAIGLGEAVDFLERIGLDSIQQHDADLVARAIDGLTGIDGVRILGPAPEHRVGLVSFTVEGIHPHDLAQVLDRHGVAIRAGHHCAQPLHVQLGIPASARASFYLYNMTEEVDRLVEGIEHAKDLLRC